MGKDDDTVWANEPMVYVNYPIATIGSRVERVIHFHPAYYWKDNIQIVFVNGEEVEWHDYYDACCTPEESLADLI